MTTNDVHPGSAVLSRVDVAVVGVAAGQITSRRGQDAVTVGGDGGLRRHDLRPDGTARGSVALGDADVNTVIARVLSLQPRISAAFVVGLDAPAATAVQHGVAERGGPLVVTRSTS